MPMRTSSAGPNSPKHVLPMFAAVCGLRHLRFAPYPRRRNRGQCRAGGGYTSVGRGGRQDRGRAVAAR